MSVVCADNSLILMEGMNQRVSIVFVIFTVAALIELPSVMRAGMLPGTDTQRAQCFSNLHCNPGSNNPINFTTVAQCCLSEQGLAYIISGEQECVACILYGWINAGSNIRRVQEAGPAQRFEVGYIKTGSAIPPRIELSIVDVEGTARRGVGFDYTVNDNMVSISSSSSDFAIVTIQVDSIALEPDETFQLRLVANNPPVGRIFCAGILDVVIEDINVVNIQLTNDDYRGNEADENIRIAVSKNARIATSMGLTVTPMVLSEARKQNMFPMNVVLPDENSGRSPVEANLNDFNDTVLTLIFQADEDDTTPRNEIELILPIVDDALNEANEQDFVVMLNLTDSINPALTTISRVSSLCRITDDDPIRIGFEREMNIFLEPIFEEDQLIYLTKENNVVSEQVFIVSFRRTDSVPVGSGYAIAEDRTDYVGISHVFARDFPPYSQRIILPFTLLADRIPEPTEAFQINMYSSPQSMPTFNSPDDITLFSRTFIVIEDDDIIVRIGFKETTYTVNERVGVQEVCVQVFEPDEGMSLNAQINAVVATRIGTADETDYTPLNPDVIILFNNATRRQCFDVTITNDVVIEGSEEFSLRLLEDPFVPPPIQTVFNSSLATVTIFNDDAIAQIGFEETAYTVNEEVGIQEVCVRVFEPREGESFDAQITAVIATRVGTADETDYTSINPSNYLARVVLTFSNTLRRKCFNLNITNDILVEGAEELSLILLNDPLFPPPTNTVFNTSMATVIILDQDKAVIGFLNTKYSASESSERATLMFGMISGGVQSSVDIQLGLSEGTALDGADFNSTGGVFIFNASSATSYSFDVPLVNDDIFEITENFNAQLNFVEATERVTINPDYAQVHIEDDDGEDISITSTAVIVVLCSLFIGAIIGGLVILWIAIYRKRKMRGDHHDQQLSSDPVYDYPLSMIPTKKISASVTVDKTYIEMEANVAYGDCRDCGQTKVQ